ncbi:MAG: S9 family peptidase [Armatimonadetes bacterium]|nr:S9 family peptidase [Armatimonadota bacterium]
MPDTLRPFTMRDLMALKSPSEPRIHPDGSRAVFAVREADFERSKRVTHLWLADLKEQSAWQITFSPEGESSPLWSPDGKYLAFLSARESGEGDEEEEEPKAQIWIMRSQGGEAWKHSDAPEGVRFFRWLPDGKGLIYLAQAPRLKALQAQYEENQKKKLDYTIEYREKFNIQVWSLEFDSKKSRKVSEGDYGIAEFDLSPDGKSLVYSTNYTGEENDYHLFDLWLLSLEDGAVRQLTSRAGAEHTPRWSPGGRSIAFLAGRDPDLSYSQEDIFLITPEGGDPVCLTESFPLSSQEIQWTDNTRLTALVEAGTHSRLYRFDIEAKTAEALVEGRLQIWDYHLLPGDGPLIYISETGETPPDIFLYAAAGEPARLSDLNPECGKAAFGQTEIVRWKSFDGLEIEGVLTRPAEGTAGPHPLVVAIHGGPYGRSLDALQGYYAAQVWANRGYVVFQPNFRGSSGYSHEFGVANREDLGGGDYRDIMAGVDWLIGQGIADPERMGVMGGSYGGYMTNWIISQTGRFAGAVSMFGMFSLLSDYGNSCISRFEKDYLGAYYWENMDLYLERSPFRYISRIHTPVLIIHGEDDPNTFIGNSREMYTALRALGRPVEFIHYPREGHGMAEPNHRLDEMERAVAWFDHFVKRHAAPPDCYELKVPVPLGNWEMAAVSAEPSEYTGSEPDGRFLEVVMTFKNLNAFRDPWVLKAGDVRLEGASGPILPVGHPACILDEDILIRGDFYLSFAPDEEEKIRVFPAAAVFDVPKEGGAFLLRVKEFPPVRFYIAPEKDEDPKDE